MNEIVKEITDIEEQIATLNEKKLELTTELIRNCNHEYIASTESHPYGRTSIVCEKCGVSMAAGITGRINTPLLSFAKSKLIICSSTDMPVRRMHISEVGVDALKYPKRFTEKYLRQILEGGPFTYEEVINSDRGHYSVNEVYDNHQEWFHSNYNV